MQTLFDAAAAARRRKWRTRVVPDSEGLHHSVKANQGLIANLSEIASYS
jgi:hypothetical protein